MPEFMEPTTKTIPIIAGKPGKPDRRVVAESLVLDDRFTAHTLRAYSWRRCPGGYALATTYKPDWRSPKAVMMHQMVFRHYHGAVPEGMNIDHIDRDKLNNLPGNLRAVPYGVNVANTNRRRDNTSGYVGVYLYRNGEWTRWCANVRVKGRKLSLGYHKTPQEAARAVNAAYRQHYPEVVIPNPDVEADTP
jgi:hypothetical protein